MAVSPLGPGDPPEIGGHRLRGRLGEGGQGVVYLGEAPDGRRVAVKVLKNADAAARGRFANEMAAARQVAPFCTAAVLDSSADGPLPYVVSEFVDGPSLEQRVVADGPLRGGDLHRLAVNTASALAAIHGAGIVHRDLKPANVLLGPDGPRVVDFGVARAMDDGDSTRLVGTPAYFAPEWLSGGAPTAASDVFAWAGTMVYAATGQPPFGRAPTLPAVLHRVANAEPDLTGVPETLRDLLRTCLDKDPARRPTARDLMVRLVDPGAPPPRRDTSLDRPIAVPDVTDPSVPAPRRHRARWAVLAASCVAVAALVVGAFVLLPDHGGKPHVRTSTGTPIQPSDDTGSPEAPATDAPSTGGVVVPAAYAGTWTGKVEQEAGFLQGASSSDVTLTLREGRSDGESSYGAWGCKDHVTVVSADGDTLVVRETPVNTAGNGGLCTGGTVTLTKRGDALEYSSHELLAVSGTLHR
ncbi:serine/threonine-protein kinase [Actinomadura atramentaria]|uniref:serine/threonine-protein kinase n=1 Tax=Actinomadura atramentaria TaxID=1990 RepID=UPI0003A3FCCF|nr:serine/threonine-protein kinase [Actinomadura atramentaria]